MSDDPVGAASDPDPTPGRPAPGGPPRWVLVTVGLAVGLLLGGGMAWWTGRDDGTSDGDVASDGSTATEGLEETPEAADAFVAAWERSRTSTYLSASLLRRTISTSVTLELPIVVAQRPPDRVVSSGGSVEGSVGGLGQVCDEQLDGMLRCAPPGDAVDEEERVAAEVATLRGYFEGDRPVYRVAQEDDCFALRLVAAIQAPPYGQRAAFCFDAASGAPRLQRIERSDSTDEVTLVSVRTDVTDEDLARVAAGEIDEELLAG